MSGRKYHDGLIHGHCSYGECSVVLDGFGIWATRTGGEWACWAAPPDTCPCCQGSGQHVGECTEVACTVCGGIGTVPGGHWPWRYPQPGPLPQMGPCAGLDSLADEECTEDKPERPEVEAAA